MSSYDAFVGQQFHRPDADEFESGGTLFGEAEQRSRERPLGLPGKAPGASVTVGLIDCLRFSRDCLIQALCTLHPELSIIPFASIGDCLSTAPVGLHLVLYYSHGEDSCETLLLQHVKQLRQAFGSTPIVVLSDARTALQPRSIRNALNSGAQGFIPTSITEMSAAVAAIRFVRDGGTFAPLDLLLTHRPTPAPSVVAGPATKQLTPRQMTVLSHLRQGKANKIIAFELGMTESTVKVHIRNIMRKMGATNRTQAVYKSQQLPDAVDA
ncbi:MAG TPA: response regulator transcription factor [Acetobacteraceae bacterium]|jgi:DNA-binding NarL/FixJ family response regulator|nr:response regulator transcription factor [Acetobacteraceae bacterium]